MNWLINKGKIRTWYRSLIENLDCLLEQFLSWLVIVVEFDDPGILRDHQKTEQRAINMEPEPGMVKIESGSLKGL